ncbi:serine hydrolase domain-containing protein [Chitinophaga tropicalis]|uniref:Serine hydrolase n=1 Tax=Chitinophaga tropicalis TaxID=2683588 RepID=A0A7K1U6W8_9BACT|nr:serine hydrolase domain-containing protein [Chitinophaga tropicalis]MVT10036.1 serine hydrolase [Chitinophaga tropicalis]
MTSRRNFIKQAGMATAGLLASQMPLNAFAAEDDKRFRQLREAIAAHANFLKIPGLIAAVVEDGQVRFVQTEGFADADKKIPMRRDHIFPVASVTKTFAAVTLMQYEQEGRVSMDDYILDYPFLPVGFTPERLQSPNVKIKHVLSHTSEGEPGSNYIYNGGRYNFIYGVFEAMSGNTRHYEAFSGEVTKRILQPLKMNDTLPGYPSDKNNPALSRIVTTYFRDRKHQSFNANRNLPDQTILYPSTNLLTTADDLAKYCHALDNNILLTAESYRKLTSPFAASDGRTYPYGLGWATQQVDGRPVHWHYGYGDSFAALLIRLPREKLSFILLCNSTPASEAFFLGYGNVLNSVFAQAFFKHIVFRRDDQFSYDALINKQVTGTDTLFYDEVFSQALMRYYTEQNYNEHKSEAAKLIHYLAVNAPARFQKTDLSLIYLLSQIADPGLKEQMETAIAAYADSNYFHPHIHERIAGWYERTGNSQAARDWYHKLADSKGYEEQGAVKSACNILGKYYLAQGEKEKGRNYLWRETLYNRYTDSGIEEASRQLTVMKSR